DVHVTAVSSPPARSLGAATGGTPFGSLVRGPDVRVRSGFHSQTAKCKINKPRGLQKATTPSEIHQTKSGGYPTNFPNNNFTIATSSYGNSPCLPCLTKSWMTDTKTTLRRVAVLTNHLSVPRKKSFHKRSLVLEGHRCKA